MDPPVDSLLKALKDETLREVYAHAVRAYPSECCGMILASGHVRPCANAMDEPANIQFCGGSRSSRSGFSLSASDALMLAESLDTHSPVAVLYHSHPDASATMTAADLRGAMCADRLAYPSLAHLIVSLSCGHVEGASLFKMREFRPELVARFDASQHRLGPTEDQPGMVAETVHKLL